MSEKQPSTSRFWERGWDGHEKAQLLRMSKLSFTDKIKWLEEAQELVERMKVREERLPDGAHSRRT